MADAIVDDATKAPNRDAATRPILSFMMSSSAYAIQDIEVVRIKLWRDRNVTLVNKPSANPPWSRSSVVSLSQVGADRHGFGIALGLILRNSHVRLPP
ncbi:hypothetical protein ACWAUC_15875 [Bradyrhizobium guangdongense]